MIFAGISSLLDKLIADLVFTVTFNKGRSINIRRQGKRRYPYIIN